MSLNVDKPNPDFFLFSSNPPPKPTSSLPESYNSNKKTYNNPCGTSTCQKTYNVESKESTLSTYGRAFMIIFLAIIFMLIVGLVVMLLNGGKRNNPGSSCDTNGDCSAGCVCHGGKCKIPLGSSCSGYSSQCVAGASCINGVCRVTPLPAAVIINNRTDSPSTPLNGVSSYQTLYVSSSPTDAQEQVYRSPDIGGRFITAFMYDNSIYLLNQDGLTLNQYNSVSAFQLNSPSNSYTLDRHINNLVVSGNRMYSIVNGVVMSAPIPLSKTTTMRGNRREVDIATSEGAQSPVIPQRVQVERNRNRRMRISPTPRTLPADVTFTNTGEVGNFIASNSVNYVVSNQPVILGDNGYRLEYNGTAYMLYDSSDNLINEFPMTYTDFETVTGQIPFIMDNGTVEFSQYKVLQFRNLYLLMSQV